MPSGRRNDILMRYTQVSIRSHVENYGYQDCRENAFFSGIGLTEKLILARGAIEG